MSTTLQILISLLKRFEGCKLHAYQDIVGIWTIGYGETLGVTEGMVWTQEQADKQLAMRALYFLTKVLKTCPQLYLEGNHRQAACGSLSYNIGVGAFSASSVKRYTMRQEYALASKSFLLWNKAKGRVINGLTIRRRIERGEYDYS